MLLSTTTSRSGTTCLSESFLQPIYEALSSALSPGSRVLNHDGSVDRAPRTSAVSSRSTSTHTPRNGVSRREVIYDPRLHAVRKSRPKAPSKVRAACSLRRRLFLNGAVVVSARSHYWARRCEHFIRVPGTATRGRRWPLCVRDAFVPARPDMASDVTFLPSTGTFTKTDFDAPTALAPGCLRARVPVTLRRHPLVLTWATALPKRTK